MKTLLTLLIVALLAGAGYFVYQKTMNLPGTSKTTATPATGNTYEWKFTEGETGSNGVPNTSVGVTINGKLYDLGDYDGHCDEIKAGEKGILGELADTSEVSRVQCSFAGVGVELGIFKTGDKLVIKKSQLDEGDAKHGPTREKFEVLMAI